MIYELWNTAQPRQIVISFFSDRSAATLVIKHNWNTESYFSCKVALRWLSIELTDDKSSLSQLMAWCLQATSNTRTHVDIDLCCHMASLGYDELNAYTYIKNCILSWLLSESIWSQVCKLLLTGVFFTLNFLNSCWKSSDGATSMNEKVHRSQKACDALAVYVWFSLHAINISHICLHEICMGCWDILLHSKEQCIGKKYTACTDSTWHLTNTIGNFPSLDLPILDWITLFLLSVRLPWGPSNQDLRCHIFKIS